MHRRLSRLDARLISAILMAGCGSSTKEADLESSLVREFDEGVDVFRDDSAAPPDDAVIAESRKTVRAKPDAGTLLRELNRVMRSSHVGHQAVAANDDCAAPTHELPREHHSRFGVCGRPSGDGVVVTFARADNALGLSAGDWVRSVDGRTGSGLFTWAIGRLACGTSALNESAERATGAASLFGVVEPGAKLEVVRGAETRTIEVPGVGANDAAWTSCLDPWGTPVEHVSLETRTDGVVVLRIRRFRESTVETLDEFVAKLREAGERQRQRPLVIDVRGNGGGLVNLVGETLRLLPNVTFGDVLQCTLKTSSEVVSIGVESASRDDPKPSKVVVITDGLSFSAGDVFPLLADRLGHATIVGTPTSGELNQGATSEPVTLGGPVALRITASPSSCSYEDQTPAAGTGANVSSFVELDPADVARGIDTQFEVAARLARE